MGKRFKKTAIEKRRGRHPGGLSFFFSGYPPHGGREGRYEGGNPTAQLRKDQQLRGRGGLLCPYKLYAYIMDVFYCFVQ